MPIYQVRGTSGSGKTTVVRRVMECVGEWESVPRPSGRRPLYYRTPADSEWGRVVVLGSYEAACGGCDGLPSVREVYELIKEIRGGNGDVPVVCEGLLLSEDTKWALQSHGLRCYYLTTPVDVCADRVKQRRGGESIDADKGPDRSGRPKPTAREKLTIRYRTIERSRIKLTDAGVPCVRCSLDQCVEMILRRLPGD